LDKLKEQLEALKAAASALPSDAPQADKDPLIAETRELLAAGSRNSMADMGLMQQMMDLLKTLMGEEAGEPGEQAMMAAEIMELVGAADAGETPESRGSTWDIRIVKYGLTKDGKDFYSTEALKAATGIYEGARVFALGESQHVDPAKSPKYGKSVKEIVGWIDNVKAGADGLYGTFHITPAAKWLRDTVVDAWNKGKKDLLGFSNDITGYVTKKVIDGKKVRYLEKVVSAEVDVVHSPIAGGEFLRMVAAQESGGKEHQMLHRLLAALEKARPDEYGKIKAKLENKETVTEDEVLNLLAAAPAAGYTMKGASQADLDTLATGLTAVRLQACASELRAELAESGLPEATKGKLRAAFEGKEFKTEDLKAAFVAEREYLGKITESGSPVAFGGRVEVTSSPERLQAAFDKMIGLDVDDEKFKDVPEFEGLRAAYTRITGDTGITGDPRNFSREYVRMCAANEGGISTSSFPVLLGNTLYRRLIAEYRRSTYGLERIISFTRKAVDYKTMQSINIGYFSDIPAVDPQVSDYTEINSTSIGEDVSSYNIANKGVILTVTRPTILNDDLGSVQKLVQRMGRAFIRTRAKNAWNLLINNSTYQPDGLGVFHANHGNLGSTSLGGTLAQDEAAIWAAILALANMTEPGSGERLGTDFIGSKLTLAVPHELAGAAIALNQAKYLDSSFTPNRLFQRFGADNKDILTQPIMTDTNDWMLIGDPSEREIIESAYLNGEEPQMFVADVPTVGQMFVADKIQYKGRHEYQDVVVEYRNAYKCVKA
jgi:hypothetical protein